MKIQVINSNEVSNSPINLLVIVAIRSSCTSRRKKIGRKTFGISGKIKDK
jgi:hypothetical protein